MHEDDDYEMESSNTKKKKRPDWITALNKKDFDPNELENAFLDLD